MPRGSGSGLFRLRLRGGTRGLMSSAGVGSQRGMGRGLLGFGIPIAAALIRDVANPDGYLRLLFKKLIRRKPAITIVDASCEQIEDRRTEAEKK